MGQPDIQSLPLKYVLNKYLLKLNHSAECELAKKILSQTRLDERQMMFYQLRTGRKGWGDPGFSQLPAPQLQVKLGSYFELPWYSKLRMPRSQWSILKKTFKELEYVKTRNRFNRLLKSIQSKGLQVKETDAIPALVFESESQLKVIALNGHRRLGIAAALLKDWESIVVPFRVVKRIHAHHCERGLLPHYTAKDAKEWFQHIMSL